ncbi:MAG: flagellin [Gemmatimonadetes bacterium]|jgi:flagellin|nr:flagellin [Gemmatimonadota bacterium]MBT5448076.1 flagellin [Gemmatimonadota bacterium]MBT5801635.1 flagellin [Gemmatimonadota bacterium]MBT6904313.1 flagellin [Gemmatimonadota bacterium]MBT7419503.1 flagellin [Gemmatimonadota bacterium]
MALRINSNVSAMSTAHTMSANNKDLGTRLERLSSGMRINTAADDAAGLSISEGFRAQITGLTMGVRNAEMGSNLVQVAEGSLNEVSSMLIRMRELAVQSSSSTFTDQNREAIEAEVNQLKQEIDRIAESTVYNDKTLLTGFGNTLDATSSSALTDVAQTGVKNISISGVPAGTYTMADNADGTISIGNGVVSQTINFNTVLDGNQMATGTTSVLNFDRLGINVTIAGSEVADVGGDYTAGDLDGKTIVVTETAGGSFQVGADDVAEDRIEVNIADMRASGVLLNLNTVSLGTQASARSSIARIDQAIDNTSQARGDLGSIMNRLQHTINFTDNSIENNTNSESALRDTDMAAEVTLFTRSQILSQAATAMLAQANTTPQQALGLLGQ